MKVSQYAPPVWEALSASLPVTENGNQALVAKTYSHSNNSSSFTLASDKATPSSPLMVSDVELQSLIEQLDAADVSGEAQKSEMDPQIFFEWMEGLSEEDRQSMHAFHRKIIEVSRGEALSEAQLAELSHQAPGVLQDFVSSQGVSLEAFIQNDAQHRGQRPEPSALQSEMMEFFQSQGVDPRQEGMKEFFDQLMEVSKNSGADWSGLESQAPQVLNDFAESQGISISALLSQLVSDMQNHGPHQGQK